jgi:hypothetical protein
MPEASGPSRAAPVRAVRRAGGSVLRGWGMATAGLRPPPDFLVIGTKRGGTTSLGRYLFSHPAVAQLFPRQGTPKGIRYVDEHPERSARWYRSHLATVVVRGPAIRPRKLAGEATANYLFHPEGAARAHAVAPDAKILVLVRDPVDRAWSHWRERTRRGVETVSFDDALAAEDERLVAAFADGGATAGNVAYRAQGRYADLLVPWFERFGRDRVLVLVSEEFYADPAARYAEALAFLGLTAHWLGEYPAYNFRQPTEAMRDQTRAELEAFFAPRNHVLEALLGRELPWSHRPRSDRQA